MSSKKQIVNNDTDSDNDDYLSDTSLPIEHGKKNNNDEDNDNNNDEDNIENIGEDNIENIDEDNIENIGEDNIENIGDDEIEPIELENKEIDEENEDKEEDDEKSEDDATEDEKSVDEKSVDDKSVELPEDDDTCIYKSAKNRDDESVVEEDYFEEDDNITNKKIYVPDSDRQTKAFLFPFEYVKLLGVRSQQLALGAKPLIYVNKKSNKHISVKDIAKMEIKEKVIPLIILRTLPNGKIEKWKITELENFNI